MEEANQIDADIAMIAEEQAALSRLTETRKVSTISLPPQSQPEPEFIPDPDIPLAPELQEYTVSVCKEGNIDPAILFALMERESRFQEGAIGYNSNGTRDHGICQLNDVTLTFLAERDIDPTESPQENIRAAVELITYYRDKRGYTLLESLAAYGVGEAGMLEGRGFEAARKLIERADSFEAIR